MKTVHKILSTQDIESTEDLNLNQGFRVEGGEFMELVIEKVYDDIISVGHYYTQRGDLMADPEARLEYPETFAGEYKVVEFRQDGTPQVFREDSEGIGGDTKYFVDKVWDKRLENQGFPQRAFDGKIEQIE